jgi:outer membrane protein OmpA-like peptidoglycan-associated protein
LNEVFRLLKSNEAMSLQVLGHTDNKGGEDYNMALSHRRADAVMSYLEKKGIDAKRLEEGYFGDTRPVADNSTEEGRQKNRRVEFRVIERHFELVE